MTERHAGTAALIVGGTQGLGLAVARSLLADGCTRLVISGRDTGRGEAAARDIGAAFLPADLEDVEGLVRTVEEADRLTGGLTALVNAAALTDRGSVLDTSPALWDRMMAANAKAPFFAIQTVARAAIAGGRPAAIVNILSMVVHCGQSFLAPYSASKAALANVTKNAASTLARHRIRVNGINCGWMDTPGEDLTQRRFHGAEDGWLAEAEARQPFGKLVKPQHVAGLVSYLLSEDSGVMTGSLIDFDQTISGAYPE